MEVWDLKPYFYPSTGGFKKKKTHTHTHTSHALSNSLMLKFGIGDSVVAGVGIADGSRAKYDVDI